VLTRRPGSSWTRGAVASAVLLLAGGCADGPVTIDSPRLTAEDSTTCEGFVADLPDELAGEARRLVSPAAAPGAAWGDPAIVLRCGVALPEDFDRFASCVEADGVGWFVPPRAEEDPDADVTLTAAGYRPVVSVEVPGDYRPEGVAAVMAELAPAVAAGLELVRPCR
jgi:hypothetical protein